MASPLLFSLSGTTGIDVGLFDGYLTLSDSVKISDTDVLDIIKVLNDIATIADSITYDVIKVLNDIVKISDSKAQTFHFSDGIKVNEPVVTLTAQKIRTDSWHVRTITYDLLLGVFGTVWSEISSTISNWIKSIRQSSNWTKT
jgi:hypothetical protein